jgi:alanyl-tRNA synthetase
MTQRLYYTDAYTTKFEALVTERLKADGQTTAVILDKTYFYPTSGGQPFDTGTLSGLQVIDVYSRTADNAVVHVLAGELWTDEVKGEINWERRFDHMQQHTGQHILSQAFIQAAKADTMSFHLGDESCTIDLNRVDLTAGQVEEAELLANQIIWENRPVWVYFVTPEQAAQLKVRKVPPVEGGQIRLIDIDQFDLTACGGTHVDHTGVVGMIKILKLERRADQLRVEFRCGRRALRDYRQKNSIINRLAAELTVGYWEVDQAIGRLREEAKQARRIIKKQEGELLRYEADQLLTQGKTRGQARVISQVFSGREIAQIRSLAAELASRPGVVALLGLAGPSAQLIFARNADAPGEMNQLIKPALQVLGPTAAGGGTVVLAQGGGPAADRERVAQALARAEKLVLGMSKTLGG